ncbi:LCP family protein [Natranaerobius thermophilus]|uniref:LCP family protein n=1 Tax=Natranaerobius thermophilus TaxID=375929 RepID=UPI002F42B70B
MSFFKKIKLPGLILLIVILLASAYAGYRVADLYYGIYNPDPESADNENNGNEIPVPPEEENILNVLLIGADGENGRGRADTIMLARYDKETKDVGLISIPRDSKVELPGRGEEKINHAFVYGGHEYLIDTVEKFLDIPIHNYVTVNMRGFKNTIDILGGVEIHVEQDMYHETWKDGELVPIINLQAGTQILDGEEALQYVRWRGDADADLGRVERQQKLVKEVIDELLQFSSVTKINQLLEQASDNVETNFRLSELMNHAVSFHNINWDDMETATLPGESQKTSAWYYMVDKEECRQAVKDIIKDDEEQEDMEQENTEQEDTDKEDTEQEGSAEGKQKLDKLRA